MNQTSVGKAGCLRLIAKLGPTVLASSAGFSVSSIPQNWSMSFKSSVTGQRRGFVVNDRWESDSRNKADLDMAEISEQVQYGAGHGSLAGRVRVRTIQDILWPIVSQPMRTALR